MLGANAVGYTPAPPAPGGVSADDFADMMRMMEPHAPAAQANSAQVDFGHAASDQEAWSRYDFHHASASAAAASVTSSTPHG